MRTHRFASMTIALLAAVCVAALVWTANAQAPSGEMPATRVLTNDEVERYLVTLDELVEVGMKVEREMGAGSSAAREMKQSTAYSQEMIGIIERHGFDPQSFTSVHWNVMMAYAAAEMTKHQPEMEEAQRQQAEQMEKMKAQLSPEQYEAMVRGMAGMNAFADMYGDVPDENQKLVERHGAQLKKVFEKAR